MTTVIALVIFLPLLMVAFAHLLWALGTSWPIQSEQLLAQTVIGRPGVTRMPNRLLILAVALLLFAAAIVAIGLADKMDGGLARTVLGAALAVAFLARGFAGYTGAWRARFPTEPFASLDRKNYSPLSLWIGAGFLILVLMRLL
ncbi:MAG TPA: DUF3995 domain-containing protein [Devosia sp.]|nr:DUF3995 domain-containing protein [Devosia sp.]